MSERDELIKEAESRTIGDGPVPEGLANWSDRRLLCALAAALRADEGWRPIAEAPPETDVLVVCETVGGNRAVGEARTHTDDGWWWANEHGEYHADQIFPTAWRPLPAPPGEKP